MFQINVGTQKGKFRECSSKLMQYFMESLSNEYTKMLNKFKVRLLTNSKKLVLTNFK